MDPAFLAAMMKYVDHRLSVALAPIFSELSFQLWKLCSVFDQIFNND